MRIFVKLKVILLLDIYHFVVNLLQKYKPVRLCLPWRGELFMLFSLISLVNFKNGYLD